MTSPLNGHPSDSQGALMVVIDHVCDNIVSPISPDDKDYPRLVEQRRRLDEAKKRGLDFIKPTNFEFSDEARRFPCP